LSHFLLRSSILLLHTWYKANFTWPIFAVLSCSSSPADLITIAGADVTWPTAGKDDDGEKNLFKLAAILG
jgi:hypothetical protein